MVHRRVLVDTHALLWWQAKHRKLSRAARTALGRADEVLVSAVTCWEVATLVGAGRIRFDRSVTEWFADLEADEHLELVPLSPRSALVACDLERAFQVTVPLGTASQIKCYVYDGQRDGAATMAGMIAEVKKAMQVRLFEPTDVFVAARHAVLAAHAFYIVEQNKVKAAG